jgi:hypothetical protein
MRKAILTCSLATQAQNVSSGLQPERNPTDPHLLEKYMAKAGQDRMPVMTFFDLISGTAFKVSSLKVMSKNAFGTLIF